jgi:hypothetical protein
MLLRITIVHGTWGRGIFPTVRSRLPFKGPQWFDDQSQFALKLCERLSKRSIFARISAFPWSGANSIFARDRAGHDLAAHLRDEAERAKGSRQVVIGHSHGGNVAIRALSHRGDSPEPITLVTLATPFVEVLVPSERPEPEIKPELSFGVRRALAPHWGSRASRAGLGILITYTVVSMLFEDPFGSPNFVQSPFFGVALGVALVVAFIVGYAYDFLMNALRDISGYREHDLAQRSSLQGFHRANTNALILRAVDDEAALTLALGAIGNRLANFLSDALERSAGIGFNVVFWALAGAILLGLSLAVC